MSRPPTRSLKLHVITSKTFIAQLKNAKSNRYARAGQSYLLSKSAIKRRQQEIQERRARGQEVVYLESMVARLEASKHAHRAHMQRLLDEE